MGIEIVPLTGDRNTTPRLAASDLAQPAFNTFQVPNPALSIWMMTVAPGQPVLPWWKYNSALDGDMEALNQSWSIPSQQGLFDCLALSHLAKFGGDQLYAIFPGCVKTNGWASLRPMDRETFTRGQGCVYHLFGAFDKQVNVNWVPFWEPQSLVKNPNFSSLWRLFSSNTGDESSRCLTMFGLSNPRKLPEITNLLISKDEQRSEKLASLVDWFGVYSSPLESRLGTCALIYTQKKEVADKLNYLQIKIADTLAKAQKDMLAETLPRTALRIMSRQVAL